MRRITIEYGEGAEGRCGFEVIDEYGRTCLGLGWDEMLGQIVALTHPEIGRPHYRMQTPEAWQAERDDRERRIADTFADSIVDETGAELFLRAIMRGVARWESFGSGKGGEVCCGGIRYSTRLDTFGRPVINPMVAGALLRAIRAGAA